VGHVEFLRHQDQLPFQDLPLHHEAEHREGAGAVELGGPHLGDLHP
jgi:hypothetical protein